MVYQYRALHAMQADVRQKLAYLCQSYGQNNYGTFLLTHTVEAVIRRRIRPRISVVFFVFLCFFSVLLIKVSFILSYRFPPVFEQTLNILCRICEQ